MSEVRLQKYLAEAGVASRRKCEELIAQGKVEINGEVITTQGTKVNGDEIIKVDGRLVRQEQKKVYILLNKPVGYISTAKDEFSRKTVLDLLDTVKERVYPVGRLDYDTSGLLLLTNDGELANRMTHPRNEMPKVYRAMIDGKIGEEDVNSLQSGIAIEDYKTAPAKVHVIETGKRETIVEITIHEGRNRQVRKMFETLGHVVLRLKRVAIGPLAIEGIEEGKWRYLRKKEIDTLKRTAGLL